MDLVSNSSKSRLLPVGRLDRNTTGLLLFTNDGDMAAKLTHPRYAVRKIYHVVLDRALKVSDLQQIEKGIELKDGPISVDAVSYIAGATKREVGLEIHSGRNRIVRRIFEHLGYEVAKLDRVMFAGLTKKDLPRGQWRALDAKEVSFLKMIGKRS
jgi:23S rRNA pseudouridine2605 synthase